MARGVLCYWIPIATQTPLAIITNAARAAFFTSNDFPKDDPSMEYDEWQRTINYVKSSVTEVGSSDVISKPEPDDTESITSTWPSVLPHLDFKYFSTLLHNQIVHATTDTPLQKIIQQATTELRIVSRFVFFILLQLPLPIL